MRRSEVHRSPRLVALLENWGVRIEDVSHQENRDLTDLNTGKSANMHAVFVNYSLGLESATSCTVLLI